MGRKKTKTDESLYMNNATYLQHYNRLLELSMSMFEWKNLPDTIDSRFLELTLFSHGNIIFFEDEIMGFLALPSSSGTTQNVYGIPTLRQAHANNGYICDLTSDNSVIIYNNLIHTNSELDVQLFAKRLYNIDRIIDVNINAQKTPVLITCDESQRLTMKNLYMQYDGNEPVIYGDKGLNTKTIGVLKTDCPFLANDLYEIKAKIWNEALTYLGISNVSINKKERLITDEVARTQGGTIASRYSRLESRRQACQQINQMFGLNITCDYREDYQPLNNRGDTNE